MRKKLMIIVVIAALALIFVIAGIPSLRYLKEHKPANLFTGSVIANSTALNISKEIIIDISVEDICLNPISGEPELECSSVAACQATCKSKGCSIFGLKYSRAEFKGNRCFCKCLELNSVNALE
jgi:hypothetical protein